MMKNTPKIVGSYLISKNFRYFLISKSFLIIAMAEWLLGFEKKPPSPKDLRIKLSLCIPNGTRLSTSKLIAVVIMMTIVGLSLWNPILTMQCRISNQLYRFFGSKSFLTARIAGPRNNFLLLLPTKAPLLFLLVILLI